ncbi:hypothetical protein CspeluHIS016_0104430 [Cutaneotrichosporon spelunceum]|uniref:NAD-dependent epimerase/dehydratase domain-containing protein n=1 Tax=Cutaneotrichosporon spelunceum TaxID=1672016 RepID=A0AAD3Y9I7_9TREE|nr:hypothetical protein CspeluHIS016_0104430 [Cutaneotrichosporon spelunceum]
MPALTAPAHILVTGASGFLGPYLVKALLAAGFTVRATARDTTKAEYLTTSFPGIEIAIVPDGAAPGAYDAAVRGVDGVVHAASPLDATNPGDPSVVIDPAVKGVTGLLASVSNTTVKRVVQISSLAAVAHPNFTVQRIYTEADWNDESPAICKVVGAAAPPMLKYLASKSLSERAFWEFFSNPQDFDGVALDCALIYGEPKGYAANQGRIEGSNGVLVPWVTASPAVDRDEETFPCVDADDVATAAVRSLTTAAAGGERFLITTSTAFNNDYAVAASEINPKVSGNADKAYRAALDAKGSRYDTVKAEKVLDITFKSKDAVLASSMRAIAAFVARNK